MAWCFFCGIDDKKVDDAPLLFLLLLHWTAAKLTSLPTHSLPDRSHVTHDDRWPPTQGRFLASGDLISADIAITIFPSDVVPTIVTIPCSASILPAVVLG